jgi:hypothetical protein
MRRTEEVVMLKDSPGTISAQTVADFQNQKYFESLLTNVEFLIGDYNHAKSPFTRDALRPKIIEQCRYILDSDAARDQT